MARKWTNNYHYATLEKNCRRTVSRSDSDRINNSRSWKITILDQTLVQSHQYAITKTQIILMTGANGKTIHGSHDS